MAGTLIVSLDFELFWGMLDVCPLEEYEQNVLGGRKAIPDTLALFQKYGIHATWATVGFMFAENAREAAAFFPEESLRPTYDNPALKPYAQFAGIGSNEEVAPCFFAPSLIAKIAAQPGQEIASHTFSHYYCREAGQTVEEFAAAEGSEVLTISAKAEEEISALSPEEQQMFLADMGLGTWGLTATGENPMPGMKSASAPTFCCGSCGCWIPISLFPETRATRPRKRTGYGTSLGPRSSGRFFRR